MNDEVWTFADLAKDCEGHYCMADALLAAACADYWHGKWPNQTQEVKRLELSAHYRGCRDAFYAGAKAANNPI